MLSLENVPKTGHLAPLGMQVEDFGSQSIRKIYSVASEFLEIPHLLCTGKRKRRILRRCVEFLFLFSGSSFQSALNLYWHNIISQMPLPILVFTLVVYMLWFGMCNMIIYHYNCMHSIFSTLKIPCALAVHHTHNHWSFSCLHNVAFYKMSYSWNHTVCSLSEWLISLTFLPCFFMAWMLISF